MAKTTVNGITFEYNVETDETTGEGYAVITDIEFAGKTTTGIEYVDLEIPAEIKGRPVMYIGKSAFSNRIGLTSVTIPDSVTRIGMSAFHDCTGLKSVTIGHGVKLIEECAFDSCCKLRNVVIPDSVTRISEHAFSNCCS